MVVKIFGCVVGVGRWIDQKSVPGLRERIPFHQEGIYML